MGQVLGNTGSAVLARVPPQQDRGHPCSPPLPHPHPSASPLDCSSKTDLRPAPLHAIVQPRPIHPRLSPCLVPLPLHACSLGALPASDTSAQGSSQNRNPIPQTETVQRLLTAHGTHLHPSSWPGSHAVSSARIHTAPQRPRGLLPSPASASLLLSPVTAGIRALACPSSTPGCVFSDRAAPGARQSSRSVGRRGLTLEKEHSGIS